MKTKLLLLIGTLVVSTVLAACTTPSGVMPPGLTRDIGSSQDQTEAAPVPPPTETAEPTETLEPSETPEDTETPEATDDGSRAGCPGNPGGTPPTAGSLATAFQVSEDDIMGWFCKGFGFGEIKKAYVWARSTGKMVDELFALKGQGMGWGEVAQGLDIQPGGKPCWAGSDHGANDPDCVKPGSKQSKDKSGERGGGNSEGKGSGKENGGGNGNGNGNGGGNSGGNGKSGKP